LPTSPFTLCAHAEVHFAGRRRAQTRPGRRQLRDRLHPRGIRQRPHVGALAVVEQLGNPWRSASLRPLAVVRMLLGDVTKHAVGEPVNAKGVVS
jgi:hypothetical protein